MSISLSFTEVFDYTKRHWGTLHREPGEAGNNPKESATQSYSVYENARNSLFPHVILGTGQIRSNQELRKSFGHLTEKKVCKKDSEEKMLSYRGSIYGGKWSTFINDLFILGTVHSGKTVYIANLSKNRLKSSDLWNDEEDRATTFGRELYILMLHGYQQYKTPFSSLCGLTFYRPQFPPLDEDNSLSLIEVRNNIDTFLLQNPKEAKRLILSFCFRDSLPLKAWREPTKPESTDLADNTILASEADSESIPK